MDATKLCRRCKQAKPLSEFGIHLTGKLGRRAQCNDCRALAEQEWRNRKGEAYREYSRVRYARQRDRIRTQRQNWANRNRKAVRETKRSYYRRNKPKCYGLTRAWGIRNIGLRRAFRALASAKALSVKIGDLKAIEAFYMDVATVEVITCHYCKQLVPRADRQVDHMTPMNRGGAHSRENLCCACAGCNMSKGDMTAEEFRAQLALPF